MLEPDRVGIVQYQALCVLSESDPLGLTLDQWRRAINARTLYGQGSVVARSLFDRGMAKLHCGVGQHASCAACRVTITEQGQDAKLRRGMVRRLLATR